MTSERFHEIRLAAHAMAGEVEWADFPTAGDAARVAWTRDVFTRMAADPAIVAVWRTMLDAIFAALESEYRAMPDHQEVELQAAGLVQTAMKAGIHDSESADLFPLPLRVKFRGMAYPVVQGPADARVPSMAEQLRLRRMGMPAVDPGE